MGCAMSTAPLCDSAATPWGRTGVYRPRRAAGTILHRVVRENLETYLTPADLETEPRGQIPFHDEKDG